MFDVRKFTLAGIASVFILAGCGGSDGTPAAAGGTTTPAPTAGTVSGTAATGSPVVGGTVTLTDSTMPTALTRTVTTAADGTFTVPNTNDLTYPVRITVSFAEGGAIRTLRSIAVTENQTGTTRANINPITDVIAGSVVNVTDVATLNTEIARLSSVLRAALANYDIPANTDFIGGAFTAAPSDPVDNALDQVSVQLNNGNIVLQSTADPSITQSIPAETANAQTTTALAEPAETASVNPNTLKTLVDALDTALARGANLTSADLDNVFHDDFQEDEGFNKAGFAEGLVEEGLVLDVTGYRILRCFMDTTTITDKCYVRVNFTSPAQEGEDFQRASSEGALTVADFTDFIVERRVVNGTAGDLKFSGGFFKPFAVTIKLFNRNIVTVDSTGVATANSTVEKGLSIDARVGGGEPATTVNSTLQTIQLVRDLDAAGESVLMSVTRSTGNQCANSNNRLNLDPANNQCGNQSFASPVQNVAAESAAGRLTAVFIKNDTTEVDVPNVRIVDPTSAALSSFGTLNQASLQALTTYAAGTGTGNVTITLTPPAGAGFVCISDGGNNSDICTYASRSVTISSTQLTRQNFYFIITRDAEGNTFQREYRLNQNSGRLPS